MYHTIRKSKKKKGIASNELKDKEKPPIILVSGWTGVAADWGAIPKMLASKTGRCFITYDARGLGNSLSISSSQPSEAHLDFNQHSLELMASDVFAVASQSIPLVMQTQNKNEQTINENSFVHEEVFRDGKNQKEIASFGIGGFSMGGMVAQLVAGAVVGSITLPHTLERKVYPKSFDLTSLALISTSPRSSSKTNDSFTKNQDEFFNAFTHWSDGNTHGKNHDCADIFFLALGDMYVHQKQNLRKRYVESFVHSRNLHIQQGSRGIHAQRHALLRDDFDSSSFLPHVGSFNIPSLIIHGRQDRIFPWENAVEIENMLKFKSADNNDSDDVTKVLIIDECDHLCWISHGLELVSTWGDFLNANR